jgi:polar amino acid transport system substrate-binding protein
MKTKQILISVSFLFMLLFMTISSCKKGQTVETTPITVSGIDIKPNVFQSDGKIVGIDADVAAQAMQDAGIPVVFNIESSWDEAFQATLTGTRRALLTVAYTKERQDQFKWAGPTSKSNYVIIAKASSGIGSYLNIEACKSIESIAVVRGWTETTTLEHEGFTNLYYCNTYDEVFAALKNNQVKAIASDMTQMSAAYNPEDFINDQLIPVCVYYTAFYFIAFSQDVDDQVVTKCQQAIDAMKTNGTEFFDIYRKYMPFAKPYMVPGLIQLIMEENPPYNYISSMVGSTITFDGSAVEIVNEIQSQNNYIEPISNTNWAAGYELLQFMPNYALFTTSRTPEREDLFQWVGPISTTNLRFFTTTASGIQIQTLDQAKALGSIATPQGWFSHDFLIQNGFQNILASANTPEEAFNQLMSGETEALLLFDTGVKWLCDNSGTPQTDIAKQLEVTSYKDYIAFSLNTSPSIVAEWQHNLDAMKADGTFESIWNKWYDGIPMP